MLSKGEETKSIPAKSKKEMQAEARAKAMKYKQSLSPKTAPKTTLKAQNRSASSQKKTPKSVQLAKAREYGNQLKLKTSPCPIPQRHAPVATVDIPTESQADVISQQTSGSFETADWTGTENETKMETVRAQELKRQAQEWESIRDQAEAARKRLMDQIDNECSDMDMD